MTQKLILELVDGQKAEASLIGSFKPDDGKIDILLDKNKACAEVNVPIDENIQQDFALSFSKFGNISGTVTVTANGGVIDPEDPPAVYITFYTIISECGYVEVATHPVYPDTEGVLTFSVDLPFGSYDVVASAEDFIPDTGPAVLDLSDKDETVDLNITEQPGI